MTSPFFLIATLSDGFKVPLDGRYNSIEAANRAASIYMRDYSDPCGLGVHVSYVSVFDQREMDAREAA
jgi:hypothetical protein